jgi:uncharacterized protein YidB (DUF937 family)
VAHLPKQQRQQQESEQMGIFDQILNNPELIGDVAKFAGDNPQIASAAMNLLGSGGNGGGVQSILSSLQSGGLGDIVSSWLGSGTNAAVAPAELESALGADQISKFASEAGVSGSEASALLAGILPQVIDKLSPDGQLPDTGALDSVLGGLMGALKKG